MTDNISFYFQVSNPFAFAVGYLYVALVK